MDIARVTSETTTARLARHILTYAQAPLSDAAWTVAKQCVLDWFAVTLAARQEPLVRILREEVGTSGPATIVGTTQKCSATDAALVNGSAAHALDYDDCHHLVGHPSVTVLAAALAVAEAQGTSGEALLRALVAGVETSAALGSIMLQTHYDAGFHATATMGTFGAAAAAGLLLGLDESQMVMALGLAGMQAAGLKSMFGTMGKPLQAGKAAANGVLAARLAQRGFTAHPDVLDTPQGFIDTHGRARPSSEIRLAAPGETIIDMLFKYHAACYMTHSAIEAVSALRAAHRLAPADITAVDLHVSPGHLKVCDIPAPRTGLEVKFSLRHLITLAAHGVDTAASETYSDEIATNAAFGAFREKVRVIGDGAGQTPADIYLTLRSGEQLHLHEDVGAPTRDLALQQDRLKRKFHSLTEPILGVERPRRLYAAIERLDRAGSVEALLQA
jgi:2-methylcitrate dehydratase PrpD